MNYIQVMKCIPPTVLLLLSLNSFAGISGYIGHQTFDLNDDPQFRQHQSNVKMLDRDFEAVIAESRSQEQIVSRWQSTVQNRRQEVQVQKERMNAVQAEIASLQQQLKALGDSLAAATTDEQKASLQNQLAATKQQLEEKKSSQQALKNHVESLNQQLASEQATLETQRAVLTTKQQHVEQARQQRQLAIAESDAYERNLINKIMEANYRGAEDGRDDGQVDGLKIARELGREDGEFDGKSDGRSDGIRAGERRDYGLGYDEGNLIGEEKATQQGEIDGTKLGTISGNTIAAKREGKAAGELRADQSDASQVGTTQGKTAGLQRAVDTGKRVGTEKGETEAIKTHEGAPLNKVKISGQFAAAFDKSTPSYPGASNYSYSTFDAHVYKRQVVKQAYIDGYDYRYHLASRNQFERSIDEIYSDYYDQSYDRFYKDYYQQFYADSFAQGKRTGESEGYAATYPVVKESFFKRFEKQFAESPNRQAAEYLSTYKKSEQDAYVRHYEEIRQDFFDQFESKTFAENIEEQTKKYRDLRYAEVDSVYKNSAVLSFVSSELHDAGIKGIAKDDGVIQPGETVLRSITLKNFGKVEAKGITATLNSGEKVILPAIPAQSQTTVAQAISKVIGNVEEETPVVLSLALNFPLTTEERIQGRHFDALKGGVLTKADSKTIIARYPFVLSNLSTSMQLIKDAVTPITVTTTNRSNRNYTGPLTLELTSSKSGVIQSPFAPLSSLAGNGVSVTSKNGNLLVKGDRDIYAPMTFTATLSQNGVLLGKLNQPFTTMAKSKFIDRQGTPLLVANSDSSYQTLLDLTAELGGIDKVSILDTSLRALNTPALTQSFSNRVAIVLPLGGVAIDSAELVKNGKNLVLLVHEDLSAQSQLANYPVFGDKFSAPLTIKDLGAKSLIVSNHHRQLNLKGSTALLTSSERSFDADYALASALALPIDELIAKIDRETTVSDFFTLRTEQSVLLSALHLKSLMEIGTINIAYDLSKKPGVFGSDLFGKRDKKWLEMIEGEQNLVINKLQKYAERAVANKAITPVLLASFQHTHMLESALKNYAPISSKIISDIANLSTKKVGSTRENISKFLKSSNSRLLDQVTYEKHLYTPFEVR